MYSKPLPRKLLCSEDAPLPMIAEGVKKLSSLEDRISFKQLSQDTRNM